ncbi:hypothetical protein ACMBCN_02875 [Candidatus Liberibacter asiaticus]
MFLSSIFSSPLWREYFLAERTRVLLCFPSFFSLLNISKRKL